MHATQHVGPSDRQHIEVTSERTRMRGEAFAAEVVFAEPVVLQQHASRTVEHENSLRRRSDKLLRARGCTSA